MPRLEENVSIVKNKSVYILGDFSRVFTQILVGSKSACFFHSPSRNLPDFVFSMTVTTANQNKRFKIREITASEEHIIFSSNVTSMNSG